MIAEGQAAPIHDALYDHDESGAQEAASELDAIGPIARAIEASIRAGPVLQLDDTPVKCQIDKATSESGKGIRQAYLW